MAVHGEPMIGGPSAGRFTAALVGSMSAREGAGPVTPSRLSGASLRPRRPVTTDEAVATRTSDPVPPVHEGFTS